MDGSPAVLLLHWWAPLHFKSSFWNVAEDELDTIGSYYELQVIAGSRGRSPLHGCPKGITASAVPSQCLAFHCCSKEEL